jgi:hypothetical protein
MGNKLCTLLASICVLAALASAQTPSARLVGRVTDTTHAAIAGATVQVRNVNTNAIRTALTQANGEYTISDLPPGMYVVTVDSAGFKQMRESNLTLQVDQQARLDVQLEVGAVRQAVDVTANVPLLNTETATRGDVITTPEIMQMPLDGRNFTDLAFMVPGVEPSQQHFKGSPYVTNGARPDAGDILINGFSDESPRDAGAQVQPPLDALQEFKLQTSNYSAEYGRVGGGVTNMVLKSGGNQFHGTAFEFVRNDFFDSRNFFDAAKAELRRNQFGATLSGPIVLPKLYNGHDKTFFLFSWESYREVQGESQLGAVPSVLERQGDFSQDLGANGKPILLKNPFASGSCTATKKTACFSGNTIPASLISPISLKIMSYYPLPNFVGPNNYLVTGHSTADWNNFLFKVDQKLGNNDTLSVLVQERRDTSLNPFPSSNLGTFSATTNTAGELYGISEERIFTPNLINEFRVGLTRTKDQELGSHAGTNYAALFGIPGTTTDPNLIDFPKFSLTGYETLGDSSSDPIRYTVNNYNSNDVLTWIKGKHTLTFGGDVLHVQYYQPNNSNFNGTFTFKGTYTGDAFADFLLGSPTQTSIKLGNVADYLYATTYGAFVQDDYKILPSLTLNLGVRYEIQGAPYEKYGQLSNFVPSIGKVILSSDRTVPNLNSILAAAGLVGDVGLASDYGLPFAVSRTNYDDFAPRIGFAWRPFNDNRTVIRSGYGIFYTESRLNPVRTDLAGGFPFTVPQTFNAPTSSATVLTLANPFPPLLAKDTSVTNAAGYQISAPTPYLQSWNFTLERDLGGGFSLEAGYAGSKGTHLDRKYDINQELHQPAFALPNGQFARPYPAWSDTEYYFFGTNSSYNAGIITLRRRFANGLFFRLSYTYSKSIDEASGENYAGAGGYQGAQNSLDLAAERGRSDFDITHYFSMDFIYRLPLGNDVILRGWELAGSGQVHSGAPFTPVLSSGNQDLGQATRPDRIGNGALPNPSPNMWFNVADFPVVPITAFAFGNSGRNILNGPGFVGFNFLLSRSFATTERSNLQLRFEVFNATNHANFNLPNMAVDTSSAGTITSALPAREIQLGGRITF